MDHQAIFIDAGYMFAVGGMQTAGTSLRSATEVNFEALLEGIVKRTEAFSGLSTLRTYWYDASRDALFTEQHKRIGMISGVKVRLGRMSVDGTQKGVDLKLGLDLVGIARNRGASTVFLLSGDDDLAEAVEVAQDFGVKVVLLGFEDQSHRLGVTSVAEHLALRVDSIITLPDDVVRSCFTKRENPRPVVAGPGGASPTPLAVRPTPTPGPHVKPRPTVSARLHVPTPTPALRAPRLENSELVYSSGAHGVAMGYSDTAIGTATDVGYAVAESWFNNTTQFAFQDLVSERPILPPEVDRVLLKDCATKIGEFKTESQAVRRELRRAFWERLDQLA
ncbi:NYN domain-containing protein [Micrococcales bacterium 31B]|nr:NYN domain-containing protein [Micrococcales bacterium 31B]